jgi:hypothetical protein
MTEERWDEAVDPSEMLTHPQVAASPRKLRLFVCACCRRIWPLLTEPLWREGVAIAERYADQLAGLQQLRRAAEAIEQIERESVGDEYWTGEVQNPPAAAVVAALKAGDMLNFSFRVGFDGPWQTGRRSESYMAGFGAVNAALTVMQASSTEGTQPWMAQLRGLKSKTDTEKGVQAQLVRDIFGNPFRPANFDPRWRISDVVTLAQAIYDDRAFDRLPILGDALMDAGCDDEQVIGHCRGPGPHVRGCWVVDLVLGKT